MFYWSKFDQSAIRNNAMIVIIMYIMLIVMPMPTLEVPVVSLDTGTALKEQDMVVKADLAKEVYMYFTYKSVLRVMSYMISNSKKN